MPARGHHSHTSLGGRITPSGGSASFKTRFWSARHRTIGDPRPVALFVQCETSNPGHRKQMSTNIVYFLKTKRSVIGNGLHPVMVTTVQFHSTDSNHPHGAPQVFCSIHRVACTTRPNTRFLCKNASLSLRPAVTGLKESPCRLIAAAALGLPSSGFYTLPPGASCSSEISEAAVVFLDS